VIIIAELGVALEVEIDIPVHPMLAGVCDGELHGEDGEVGVSNQ